MWLKWNVWLQSRDSHQLIYISQSSCEWRKCYLSVTGEGRKSECWSLALKPRDSGCVLLAVLFPSIRGALCPSISSGCSQLCFGCDCCSHVKRNDYVAPTLPLSTSKGCYWSSYSVPGTSVLQIWWKSFWQLFLHPCGYLSSKILQKLKLCVFIFQVANSMHLPRVENTLGTNCWF